MNEKAEITRKSSLALILIGAGILLIPTTIIIAGGITMFKNLVTENKEAFLKRVQEISAQLNINPDWLMAVMAFESNINHRVVNSTSGATGLIQFMPATALSLGTSTSALKAMSNVEQLNFVYRYLNPYRSKFRQPTDLYLTVFYPAAVGKPDTYVIGAKGSAVANQNPALRDSTGAVTVASVKANYTNWVKKRGYTFA